MAQMASTQIMTLRQRLLAARARLIAAGVDNNEAVLDTNLLARHVLGWSRAEMLMRQDDPTPDGFEDAFNALVERRARREPAAYIRGLQEFWSRDFLVTTEVLIPRPESELIVEELLALLPVDAPALPRRVADVGTGSGCIAVTVAAERPHVHVVATDISRPALDVARKNAARIGVAPRIEFLECAYLSGTTGLFDFILSNPPYVAEAEYEELQPEVREYEPAIALQAGGDGLRDIRQIVDLSAERLKPGGTLFMEIGHQQAEPLAELVKQFPSLTLARISHDLQRIPRVAVIERKITNDE
jgi:release factor glutamine methyltransferase